MRLKKVLSGFVTAVMVGTMMCTTAFAADYTNGEYTGEVHFKNFTNPENNSMCDPIFVHETDITLTDDSAELTCYVAYPIPAFSDQGTDGTLKDVTFTVDEVEYEAESDIESKPVKTFDTASPIFGITEGDELPTQVLTVTLPRDAVDDLEAGTVKVSAYVNVFMNNTQDFYIKVGNLQAEGGTDPVQETKDMEITAEVEEPVSEPSYTVTVPGSVAMGTLSGEQDNNMAYTVDVAAADLNGTLSVSAPEAGNLSGGSSSLSFTNTFGTQKVTEDTDDAQLSGSINVKAADVAKAAAGNYTGTTTFTITYQGK